MEIGIFLIIEMIPFAKFALLILVVGAHIYLQCFYLLFGHNCAIASKNNNFKH